VLAPQQSLKPRARPLSGPTPEYERIQLLDAIRGIALCGILLANLRTHRRDAGSPRTAPPLRPHGRIVTTHRYRSHARHAKKTEVGDHCAVADRTVWRRGRSGARALRRPVLSENSIGRTIPNDLCAGIGNALGTARQRFAGSGVPNLGPNLGPITPEHQGKPASTTYQKTRPANKIDNRAESAKPPSPVQIRAAPPNFQCEFVDSAIQTAAAASAVVLGCSRIRLRRS
jgi:hypothetical protein